MKTLAFIAGILTGLAFSRIPHYVGPIFNDLPITPAGQEMKSRWWNGGVATEGAWPPPPIVDPEAFERTS
ncbi:MULTISPECIES: hypothetical protein [unclassified Microbacterium]|uniref:hypothetical protein n=1 Tax=unclassified Microbacterium TaxID=2609290 RepID=UPI000EAA62B3|nr:MULTISPECIES: hypothetical protein [unclassified Microbacterium]MBT2484772.1 hypothetical protein [Microbacterium sp. ISL-108]RKN67648.1 hypothetical protein D7252_08670 [Microbacterium sp. CGR2]